MESNEIARRKKEWLEKLEHVDKQTKNLSHEFGLKVIQNNMRGKILVFLGSERKSFEEIKERLNLNDNMANFHLSMLEKALYIEKKKRKEKYSISQLC